MNTNTVTNSAQRSHGNTAGTGTNWQTAAIIVAALAACPTLVLGLILPCFFILVPIIALMIYGIIIAGIQLCQA
jgi:hypothetical protein